MRLYAGSSEQFIEDTTRNQIAEKLRDAFHYHLRYEPGPAEVNSWRNSLRALASVFGSTGLTDHGVILEYQIPFTSLRLDCMITGTDSEKSANAVIVEMKQWERSQPADGDNEVVSWVGGNLREVLHPSVQVLRYKTFLQDTDTVFHEGDCPIGLHACSYLHNYFYDSADPIFAPKFEMPLSDAPLFSADQVPQMRTFLKRHLSGGRGMEVLNRIEESKYRPSRKLMQHVGNIVKGKSEYVLLDEQLVVYDKVLSCAADRFHDRKKTTIIVRGGPGTGKSVIALNLMADLMLRGYNAHYATGSKAFTETLRQITGPRASIQFKYFNSYGSAERDQIDVLIADESHRIRETSHNRFTPAAKRSGLPQVQELLQAARVSVFFIDDVQVVRPDEVGSSEYIRNNAKTLGHQIFEYKLDVQFRCAGSEGFINWVDNTLGIRRTPNIIWDRDDQFDFQVVESPALLDRLIRAKAEAGFSSRMTAGFCWKWSDPDPDGTLPADVVVGEFRRPWNAKPDAGRLAAGIPKAPLWANTPSGMDQIGCIYTAQGFEFDYVGVIWGRDLVYRFDDSSWIADRDASADNFVKRNAKADEFLALVKNTYRVLLTRGMKGCYVCFLDKETERFVRSRLENPPRVASV